MHYLGCKFKIYRTVFVHFPGKLFIITVVLVSALNPDCEEVQVDQFCEDKHDFLELQMKDVLIIIRIGMQKEKVKR